MMAAQQWIMSQNNSSISQAILITLAALFIIILVLACLLPQLVCRRHIKEMQEYSEIEGNDSPAIRYTPGQRKDSYIELWITIPLPLILFVHSSLFESHCSI